MVQTITFNKGKGILKLARDSAPTQPACPGRAPGTGGSLAHRGRGDSEP